MRSEHQPGEVTRLIRRALEGDRVAEEQLIEELFDTLRDRAKRLLPHNQGSIQATQLVHDAWMRVFHGTADPQLDNQVAFFAYMAKAMRRLVIDYVRAKRGPKRTYVVELEQLEVEFRGLAGIDLIHLNDAMSELLDENSRLFRTVEMKFFGGMTMRQIADFHGVSITTAENDWSLARAKLRRKLRDHFPEE